MLPLQVQLATCSYYKEMLVLHPLSLKQFPLTSFLKAATERVLFYFTKGHLTLPKSPAGSFSLLCVPSGESGSSCLLGLPGRRLELARPCQRDTRNKLNQAGNALNQVWGPPGHFDLIFPDGSCDLVTLACQSLTHFTEL